MSEQKWITITVPVEVMPASSPSGDASGTFESFEGDGDRDARRGLWVRHDGREMRARNVHLVAGMARAWLMEPATDWQERVLNEVLLLPISAERGERERCAAEIVRYGIPAVAFAIDRAWNEGADAERNAAARATKVKPATDYAKKVAEIVEWVAHMSQDPDFVTVAAWEYVPFLLAQLRSVDAALAAAGIPSDGRAPAERIGDLAAALRATKVLAADGTIGEAGEDILRAAEMLRRVRDGAMVEHRCGGLPTCPMCALVPSVRGPADLGLHVEEPARHGVEQAERHGGDPGGDGAHAGSIAAGAMSRKGNRQEDFLQAQIGQIDTMLADIPRRRAIERAGLEAQREEAAAELAAQRERVGLPAYRYRPGTRGASPIAPEPPPAKTGSTPVWPLVIDDVEKLGFEDPVRGLLVADMRARDAFGREKYGTPLTSDNGRDHLRDAYQEALDEVVYLRAAIGATSEEADLPEPQAGGLGLSPAEAAKRYPDALAGLTDEQRRHLTALADPLRRARFHGSTARILVFDAPVPADRREAARMREYINKEFDLSITAADLATALGISEADVLLIEAGASSTDAAGWVEIQTACFALGSGMKPEHIADPTSSPSFARAMEREEEDDRVHAVANMGDLYALCGFALAPSDRVALAREGGWTCVECTRGLSPSPPCECGYGCSSGHGCRASGEEDGAQPPPDQAVDEPAVGDEP